MCFVAVVDPPDGEVPVQLPGVDVELEVVVAELEAGQREHHGLGGQLRPVTGETFEMNQKLWQDSGKSL